MFADTPIEADLFNVQVIFGEKKTEENGKIVSPSGIERGGKNRQTDR